MNDEAADPTESGGGGDVTGRGMARGTTFAGLEIEAEVGRGGMGVIYRGRDLALEQTRALKILASDLSRDPKYRERFRRESRLAASIEHPNVATVYQAGEQDEHLYLVMRFVDGPSLQELLAERGLLEPDHAAALTSQVAAALDAAHARGLIHRDVKPANVLLEGEPGRERAFLCDFGISKLASAGTELTTTGEFLGTVDYVAPEQIGGEPVDARTDVYSLACVLYHAITGSPPFSRETQLATLFAHTNAPRPLASQKIPGLPAEVDRVLARGMATAPGDRFASTGEFAREFVRALGGGAAEAVTSRLPQSRPRRRFALLAAIAVAAMAAAGILIAVSGGGSSDQAGASIEPVATIDVPHGPVGLTVSPFRVWVASPSEHVVSAIAPIQKHVESELPIGRQPVAVAFGFDSIWTADRSGEALIRIDSHTGRAIKKIAVGDQPFAVAVSDRWVWVANRGDDTVSRIDPRTNQVTGPPVPVGSDPNAIAAAPFAVWVSNAGDGSVSKINARTAQTVGKPIPVGRTPEDLAVGRGSVWVIDNFNGTLSRIDPDSMRVVGEPVDVGAKPRAVSIGLDNVWVTSGEDDAVDRVDPHTGQVVGAPIPVGDVPRSIDIRNGAVWIANFGDSTVTELKP